MHLAIREETLAEAMARAAIGHLCSAHDTREFSP